MVMVTPAQRRINPIQKQAMAFSYEISFPYQTYLRPVCEIDSSKYDFIYQIQQA